MGRRSLRLLGSFAAAVIAVLIVAPAACLAGPSVSPPTISIAFGAPTLAVNETTTLTFTIGNPNTNLTQGGIGVTDPLPSGLVVASPNGLSGSCGGGTIVAVASSSSVSLSGATLAANSSCVFLINVLGISPGLQTDTTGAVSATQGGAGLTATASITLGWAPTMGMSFTPSTIPLNGTSTLTFTIYNPEVSSTNLIGLGFVVVLPAGLTVANSSSTVCSFESVPGTLTTNGGNTIALSGESLAISDSCSFSVTVTGSTTNALYKATSSALVSGNGIPGPAATASIIVGSLATPPPSATAPTGTPAGRSDETLPLTMLLAFGIGLFATRRAAMRKTRAGRAQ